MTQEQRELRTKVLFIMTTLAFTCACSFIMAIVVTAPKGYFSW